jgi:hypothetical protein
MPSTALIDWQTSAAEALSQLEATHRAIGGTRAGRLTNILQLNYAFVLLLSAHLQAYSRGLHSEATQWLADVVAHGVGAVLALNLTLHRQFDNHGWLVEASDPEFVDRFRFLVWFRRVRSLVEPAISLHFPRS